MSNAGETAAQAEKDGVVERASPESSCLELTQRVVSGSAPDHRDTEFIKSQNSIDNENKKVLDPVEIKGSEACLHNFGHILSKCNTTAQTNLGIDCKRSSANELTVQSKNSNLAIQRRSPLVTNESEFSEGKKSFTVSI